MRRLFPLLTLALVAAVVANVDVRAAATFFRRVPMAPLITAYLLYIASFAARALRWLVLIEGEGFFKLFRVVAIHTLSNNVYPARTGELSFIYLLKHHPSGRLSYILLSARVADMLCIGTFFGVSVLHVGKSKSLLAPAAAALLVCLLFTAAVVYAALKAPADRLPPKVSGFLEDFKASYSNLRGKFPQLFATSLMVWTAKYASFFFLTNAVLETMGRRVDFWSSVFGVSFSELTTVLPIHSIGGFGTFEAGWAGAYMLLGFPREEAVTSGLLFHVSLLSFCLLTGLPFLLLHHKVNEKLNGGG